MLKTPCFPSSGQFLPIYAVTKLVRKKLEMKFLANQNLPLTHVLDFFDFS